MSKAIKGKTYFIGAGPGDPALLTIKAAQILQKADVIITDRLVSEEIFTNYANPLAHIIPVGKQGGSSSSKSQKDINDILVNAAKRYSTVVRLKGGDVSLFSNILDELLTVNAAGISYEIIPGISAVSGAAAYTGIPLTARGYASGIRILTYYDESAIHDDAWSELAKFDDTLVFYMSANKQNEVASKLIYAGANPSTPLVVIEQATTPNQYVHEYILGDVVFDDKTFISPSLVIIGKVVSFYKEFAWLSNGERIPYFSQLKNFPQPIKLTTGKKELNVSRA